MKALQFSGGKDSLAVLFLKRPEWHDITVMWANTGLAYQDTLALMDRIKALVPNFVEVKSDKKHWESMNGIAVDVVPERYTLLGRQIHAPNDVPTYTSFLRCCASNLWAPMAGAMRKLGVTHIIRGQRKSDIRKSSATNGYIDPNGVTYEFPIESWSDSQVLEYCRTICPEFLPAYYADEKVSHDCWDCIAYLAENSQRIQNLPDEHRRVVKERLDNYESALQLDLGALYHVHSRTA